MCVDRTLKSALNWSLHSIVAFGNPADATTQEDKASLLKDERPG